MEAFVSIVVIALVTVAIAWWRNSAEDMEKNKKSGNDTAIEQNTALKISFSALQSIGCQPTIDGNSISVSYQGENFQFECGGPYARIWDPSWSHIKACIIRSIATQYFSPNSLLTTRN